MANKYGGNSNLVSHADSMDSLIELTSGRDAQALKTKLGFKCMTTAQAGSGATRIRLMHEETSNMLVRFVNRMKSAGSHCQLYKNFSDIVVVGVPHIEANASGSVTVSLSDTAKLDGSPLPDQSRTVPLGRGPFYVVLYPNYSIPVGDKERGTDNMHRIFTIDVVIDGVTNLTDKASALSIYPCWDQKISSKTIYGYNRPAVLGAVKKLNLLCQVQTTDNLGSVVRGVYDTTAHSTNGVVLPKLMDAIKDNNNQSKRHNSQFGKSTTAYIIEEPREEDEYGFPGNGSPNGRKDETHAGGGTANFTGDTGGQPPANKRGANKPDHSGTVGKTVR